MKTFARIGAALLTTYALGWVALGVWVGVGSGDIGGATFFLVAGAICAGLAVLGLRRPFAAGALLLVPGTFPLGLAMAGLSDASGWAAIAALLWFAVAPFSIGVLYLVTASVAATTRRRQRSADIQMRPPLPPGAGQAT